MQLTRKPFSIEVTRKSSGEVLFNSTTPSELSKLPFQGLTVGALQLAFCPSARASSVSSLPLRRCFLQFSEQYLEISTNLAPPSDLSLYGLGEHISTFRIDRSEAEGNTFTIMARDRGTPQHQTLGNTNLYGSHALYLGLYHATGNAHGVFLLNSNGMDVVVQVSATGVTQCPNAHTAVIAFPPSSLLLPLPSFSPLHSFSPSLNQNNALTYRVIGGVLDFYIFTGPSMHQVVQQYTDVVGKPFLPPYWSLGFHLCRWGYGSLNATKAVVQGMADHNLPQDVQWNGETH